MITEEAQSPRTW